MIIDNIENNFIMNDELNLILNRFRSYRDFNISNYLEVKLDKLVRYVTDSSITHIVIGVSGGVDSAVCLSILNMLKEDYIPTLNIVPVFLPAFNTNAVSGQDDAFLMAKKICDKLSLDLKVVDLNESTNVLSSAISKEMSLPLNDWAKGQLVSYLRTPSFYFITSLINQEKGNLAVTSTCINASEGQYIGYFGKAGDSMADLQLISDIYKSEVYKLAEYFSVPIEIIKRKPLPDMFDGKDDESIFGFPYDFLELYQSLMILKSPIKAIFKTMLTKETLVLFETWETNINLMHSYNKHKYLGYSPSVHFDVLDSKVPNGWKYFIYE